MEIELINTGDINPAKYNPRTISKEALGGLKQSILRSGKDGIKINNEKVSWNQFKGFD